MLRNVIGYFAAIGIAFTSFPVASADTNSTLEAVSTESIPFNERVVEDSKLPDGVKVVVQAGKNGVLTHYKESKPVQAGTQLTTFSRITTLPTEQVIRVGTNTDVINGVDEKIVEQKKERERQQAAARRSQERRATTVDTDYTPGDSAPSGYTTPAENRAYAMSILSPEEFAAFDWIIQRESGWRTDATNPSSGAYGVAQSLPAEKYASLGPDWRTNGRLQVDWAINYMRSRYGSIAGAKSFWERHHWY